MSPSSAPPEAPRKRVPDASWARALQEHREALATFLESAASVDMPRWMRPVAPDKWTPGQITEHLSLAYEAVLTELAGGPSLAPRVTGWRRRILRTLIFPHILFHRSFPLRAISPREIRPPAPESLQGRDGALHRLRELGTAVERDIEAARTMGTTSLTHPYFGDIPLDGAI